MSPGGTTSSSSTPDHKGESYRSLIERRLANRGPLCPTVSTGFPLKFARRIREQSASKAETFPQQNERSLKCPAINELISNCEKYCSKGGVTHL